MLNRQIQMYSVDTKAFYDKDEWKLYKKISRRKVLKKIKEEFALYEHAISEGEKPKYIFKDFKDLFKQKRKSQYIQRYLNKLQKDYKDYIKNEDFKKKLYKDDQYVKAKDEIKDFTDKLETMLENHEKQRVLNEKHISKYNIISVFESYLSRTLGHEINKLTEDIIVIRILHYSVLKQLIHKGFIFKGEEYITFTSSAGQIRQKKIVFVKKKIWNEFVNTIMCGLSIEEINKSEQKGCNINKFLAYLALTTSATDKIKGFDIDRAIVIDDFETPVHGEVDYIHNKEFTVERLIMDIPITHSDGCGWVLPSVSNKSFMIRLPWVKGLVTPVDCIAFIDEYKKDIPIDKRYKITDIYKKEWDLKADKIEYVFTKSQFKMWKYYSTWDSYKDKFKQYNCHASFCNLEPNTKDFSYANFNYQMWQTLTDITDEEIEFFTKKVDESITKAYTDRAEQLKIMGATDKNKKRNNLQEALMIYPELLKDKHVQDELLDIINSKKKDAKYGKFPVNAKYTFLIPDIFAWMQYVFLGNKNPIGLLKNGQVSCKLFSNKKLLVNRSPHLYREHCVRENITNKDIKKWFITDGVYTSCHDLISKTLQFDNDGDKALVAAEDKLNEIAERNMKDIVPLYYEMGKAEAKIIEPTSIYESLTTAFQYGNIGKYSNQLTVLWNMDNSTKDLKLHKIITALNNFSIDAAKTLLMPDIPKDIQKAMKEVNKSKLPYFFQFAKDKDPSLVNPINNSTVNRICKKIEGIKQQKFDFGKLYFRSSTLMKNNKIEINQKIIDKYNELNKKKDRYFYKNKDMTKEEIAQAVWEEMKAEFDIFCRSKGVLFEDAVDMVLKHTYKKNRTCKKTFIFSVFGDVIVNNLKENIEKLKQEKDTIICKLCGKRVKTKSKNKKYCDDCYGEKRKQYKKQKQREYRDVDKSKTD